MLHQPEALELQVAQQVPVRQERLRAYQVPELVVGAVLVSVRLSQEMAPRTSFKVERAADLEVKAADPEDQAELVGKAD